MILSTALWRNGGNEGKILTFITCYTFTADVYLELHKINSPGLIDAELIKIQ